MAAMVGRAGLGWPVGLAGAPPCSGVAVTAAPAAPAVLLAGKAATVGCWR